MTVSFFSEAGKNIGYGHIMRCLALAQGLDDIDAEIIFNINGKTERIKKLEAYNTSYYDWINKDSKRRKIIQKSDIAVIDSYLCPSEIYQDIAGKIDKCVYFDDCNRMEYPKGFIINGVIGAENIQYLVRKDQLYLLGPKYQPLRKVFWNVRNHAVSNTIDTYLIMFGGSDIKNKSPGILSMLVNNFPDRKKRIVVGNGFQNISEINHAADENTELYFDPDDQELIEVMMSADIAISAAGQTISELACIGVPTIGIMVAENQQMNIDEWRKAGFLQTDLAENLDMSYHVRKKVGAIGRELIDGWGVKRIVEKLLDD